MEDRLFACINAINAIANKMTELLEEEELTYTSSMEDCKRPEETDADYYKKNLVRHKQLVRDAHTTLYQLKTYIEFIERIGNEEAERHKNSQM